MAEGEVSVPDSQRGQYTSNQGYNTAGILAIRLDTDSTLERLEFFLRGEIRVNTVDADGNPTVDIKKLGVRKCNDAGVQGIMAFVVSAVNSSTVQGNITQEDWRKRNKYFRWESCIMLVTNCDTWEIRDADIEPINNTIINTIYAFSSRLIDNKERESYSSYTQSQVTTERQGSRGIFGMFSGNK